MGRCIYCEGPAGFLRRRHADCEARHTRALSIIPELFTKAMHSSLPAERFSALLREAAGASFIKPRDLGPLCIRSMIGMIDSVLEHRLLTEAEDARIEEIREALGSNVPETSKLEEKLVKITILRELAAGDIPNRVDVVGAMPFELRRHETVIWIFNRAVSFEPRNARVASLGITLPASEQDPYCGPGALANDPMPMGNLSEEATGDLIVTSRNLYFVAAEGQKRIPIAKITALQPHSDGIQVTCQDSPERCRSFKLDDPWLATNMIIGLVGQVHNPSRGRNDSVPAPSPGA